METNKSQKANELGYNKLRDKGMILTVTDFLAFIKGLAKVYDERCKKNFGQNYVEKTYSFNGVWVEFAKKIMQADGCAFNGDLISARQLQLFNVEQEKERNFLKELNANDGEVSSEKLAAYFGAFQKDTIIRFDGNIIYQCGKRRETVQHLIDRVSEAFAFFAYEINRVRNEKRNAKLKARKAELLKELSEIDEELNESI